MPKIRSGLRKIVMVAFTEKQRTYLIQHIQIIYTYHIKFPLGGSNFSNSQ